MSDLDIPKLKLALTANADDASREAYALICNLQTHIAELEKLQAEYKYLEDSFLRLEQENLTLRTVGVTMDKRVAELETQLNEFHNIVNESIGVAGFHLNGEVATWEYLGVTGESNATIQD